MPNLHGLRRNRDYERLLKYGSSSQEKVKILGLFIHTGTKMGILEQPKK